MNAIFLTPAAKLVYDAVHRATDGGARVFEGHLRVDVDHGQVSREIARMAELGVLESELIDPEATRRGRRIRILVPAEAIEVAGRRRRTARRAAEGEDEETEALKRRRRDLRRFEVAWEAALPGARYEDDPRGFASEPLWRLPPGPEARAL